MTDNPTPAPAGFDFNRPTIISLLYLSSFLVGLTGLIGVILAFVWRGEPMADWERSHYTYLINTFWIGLLGSIVGVILTFVIIGIFVLLGVMVLVVIRSVLSLVNAQKRQPMPKPDTWLA